MVCFCQRRPGLRAEIEWRLPGRLHIRKRLDGLDSPHGTLETGAMLWGLCVVVLASPFVTGLVAQTTPTRNWGLRADWTPASSVPKSAHRARGQTFGKRVSRIEGRGSHVEGVYGFSASSVYRRRTVSGRVERSRVLPEPLLLSAASIESIPVSSDDAPRTASIRHATRPTHSEPTAGAQVKIRERLRFGAAQRVAEIEAELAAIWTAFPELRSRRRIEFGGRGATLAHQNEDDQQGSQMRHRTFTAAQGAELGRRMKVYRARRRRVET